jgi:hypothetical protein
MQYGQQVGGQGCKKSKKQERKVALDLGKSDLALNFCKLQTRELTPCIQRPFIFYSPPLANQELNPNGN